MDACGVGAGYFFSTLVRKYWIPQYLHNVIALALGCIIFALSNMLEAESGRPIASLQNPPVEGEFELPNATIATKRLDLAPYYPTLERGSYRLSGSVTLSDWNQTVDIPSTRFTIITGTVSYQGFGPGPHIVQVSTYKDNATVDAFTSPGTAPFRTSMASS